MRIPTLGNDDIELGFEVIPLDDDELNRVEVNEVKKRKAEPEPQVPFPVHPVQPVPNFPASTTPLVSRIANQAPLFSGPPLLHHPIVPILQPKVVFIQEPEEPEPEPVSNIRSCTFIDQSKKDIKFCGSMLKTK